MWDVVALAEASAGREVVDGVEDGVLVDFDERRVAMVLGPVAIAADGIWAGCGWELGEHAVVDDGVAGRAMKRVEFRLGVFVY